MRIQLSLAERVRILKKLFSETPVTKTEDSEYIEITFDQLLNAGFPKSATNPAYWSGTMPGIRAAIICGKVTWFSEKLKVIRFRNITPSEKLVWEQRLAKLKNKTLLSSIIKEDSGDSEE